MATILLIPITVLLPLKQLKKPPLRGKHNNQTQTK